MTEHNLSARQLAILRTLWDRGEVTVADIWAGQMEEPRLAHTTLATMLTRLERRGIVAHRTVARQFMYRALISEQDARHSMVSELTGRLFEGDISALVSHLLTSEEISPGDRARIRAMLDAATSEENSA